MAGGALALDQSVAAHAFTVGALAGSGNIALQDNAAAPNPVALTVGGNGASATFSGVLSGPGSLAKSGGGVLTLAGLNTYAGATVISAGTLQFGGLPTPQVSFNFNSSSGTASGSIVYNSGSLLSASNGTLGGASIVSGVGLNGGNAMNVANGGQDLMIPALSLGSNWTAAGWFSGLYAGGYCTLFWGDNYNPVLTAGNHLGTYYYSGFSGPSPAVDMTGYVGSPGWNQITAVGSGGNTYFYINGSFVGSVNVENTDIIAAIGSANDSGQAFAKYIDDVNIYQSALSAAQVQLLYDFGNLQAGSPPILPGQTAVQIATGAALDLNGASRQVGSLNDYAPGSQGMVTNGAATPATLTLASSGGTATFSGSIGDGSGGVSLTINGSGTQILAGANTFSGATTLSAGTLNLSNQNALQNSTLNMAGGVLALDQSVAAHAFTVGGLSGLGNIALQDNAAAPNPVALTVGGNNASNTFSGVLSGPGSLAKAGTGVLTLANVNTYAGATVISAGTLQLGGLPTPQVCFNFDSSSGTASGSIVYNSGSLLSASNGTLAGGASIVSGVGLGGGNALSIANGAQYLSLPQMSLASGSWTVSGWFYGLYGGGYHTLFWGNNYNPVLTAGNNLGTWLPSGFSGPSPAVDMTSYVGQQAWNQVAAVGSGGNTYFYIDGNFVGSALGENTSYIASIGNALGNGQAFAQYIDDVDMYQSALSAAQVKLLYALGNPLTGVLPALTPVQIAAGATLDLNGFSQQVGSLNDCVPGSQGMVTNGAATPATLTLAPSGGTATFSGSIGDGNGGVSLVINGAGVQVLAGSNTYSGATTIVGGTLQIGNGGSGEGLASPSVTMSNNATLAFNHADPLSYSGAISGSGQLVKLGVGVLDLSGTSTYSGPTTISAGTVELDGNGNNLPLATALTIASGGVLDLAGVPQTVGSLSGSAGAIITNRYASYPATLTVAASSGSTTFAGNIIGNDLLVLSGSGQLTLSGTNAYTGGTTVSGGTLDIAAPSALAGSGLVTIAAGGRLVLGSGAGIGALLAASSPTASGAAALSAAASIPATMGGYASASESMATLGDAPPLSQGGGGIAVGGSAAAVPEPGTLALLLAGFLALAAIRRMWT